jgi:preprotein translocase subunit SecE
LLHKVSWPTWTELQESAGVVAVASIIIALVIFGMDYGFSALMKTLYQVL